MSAYTKLEKDFVVRSSKILKKVQKQKGGRYKTTHLINLCLGLLAFPCEKLDDAHWASVDSYLENYGISPDDIVQIKYDDKSIKNIIRRLRNGIAHGHIEQLVVRGRIVGLKIKDRDNAHSPYHSEINISVLQLQKLVLKFAEEYTRII